MSRPSFEIFAQHYLSTILSNFGKVYLNEPVPRDPKLRIYKLPSRLGWRTDYLTAITAGNNRVMISPEVIGEAEMVNVLFEPDPDKSRVSLGLLGELTSVPCIIETLRSLPDTGALQTCLQYWLRWKTEDSGGMIPIDETPVYPDDDDDYDDYDEESDIEEEEEEFVVNKTLLIIVPSISRQNLEGFRAKPSGRNIPGIYEFAPAFCTTIIVTSLLPVNASTLWLRLLGRGPTQRSAILELVAPDIKHPHDAEVRQQLREWYRILLEGNMGKESKRLMETLAIVDRF
jgi:hypothetical protein